MTATIALVMKHVIEERLACFDDALRGAHWRHEAGASACSLVRASHLGELTFPSAGQSAREALSSARLSSRFSAARRSLVLMAAVKSRGRVNLIECLPRPSVRATSLTTCSSRLAQNQHVERSLQMRSARDARSP